MNTRFVSKEFEELIHKANPDQLREALMESASWISACMCSDNCEGEFYRWMKRYEKAIQEKLK